MFKLSFTLLVIFIHFTSTLGVDKLGEEYPLLVERCITDYKTCVQQPGMDCRNCIQSCGNQEIITSADSQICSLLLGVCQSLVSSTDPTQAQCIQPQCVFYFNSCKENGPDSVDCKYCGNFCENCPDQYQLCIGSQPPTLPTGVCTIDACTYYRRLCEANPFSVMCKSCMTACAGLCETERKFCDARLD